MKIRRDLYVKRLADFMWDGQVKVIAGIRGCGKSYLLHSLFREHLLSCGVAEDHILSCDLGTEQDLCCRNPLELASCFRRRIRGASGQFYLFIDGIHKCEAVPNPYIPDGNTITVFDALNDLKSIPNLDVYVISDNSMMLASNLPTEFRGRSDQIRVHPLSFSEYYAAAGGDREEAFEQYALYGGMPYCLSLPCDARKEYLRSVLFDDIVRETAAGRKIRRPEMLTSLAEVLSLSAGTMTDTDSIAAALNAGQAQNRKRPVALNTVKSHLDCLSDVFLFSLCRQWDVRDKCYAGFPGRYYCEDTGLRNAAAGFRHKDMSHVMENILFNDLVARGCNVNAGIVYDSRNSAGSSMPDARGIDFIANYAGKKFYIQSACAIESEEQYAAASRPLKIVNDSFPKIMVRHDMRSRWYDDYGILNIGVLDFLLDDTLLSRYP